MPCRCDINFDDYKFYPPTRITNFDVQDLMTSILGLEKLGDKLVGPKEVLEYREHRERLGNSKFQSENESKIGRVFLFRSIDSKPMEAYFIPRLEEEFLPIPCDGRGIANLQQYNQSVVINNGLTSEERQFILSAKTKTERDSILRGKVGKMTIITDKLLDGIGGLPGLSSPNSAPEYDHDISASERKALCEKLITSTIVNQFTISCPALSIKTPSKQQINRNIHQQALLENKNILGSIFEYINTLDLVNVVASVCSLFHELIIFNQESGSQIFGGRILNICKANNLNLGYADILEIKKMHQSSSWLEFYLLSGMVYFECLKKEISEVLFAPEVSSGFDFGGCVMKYLILDPTILVENPAISKVLERRRKKIIAADSRSSMYSNVTHKIEAPSNIQSLISSILYSPVICCNRNEFSVELERGVPLYLNFLKEMGNKLENNALLSTDNPKQLRCLQYVSEKIVEKAKYFIEQSNTRCFDTAPDDVLLGLHFVTLDNYYSGFGDHHMVYLNFTNLLRNRTQSNDSTHSDLKSCKFPNDLSIDFLSLLISGNIEIPTSHQFNDRGLFLSSSSPFDYVSWEKKIEQIQLFIKEHIIELSQVSIHTPAGYLLSDYIEFLKDWENERPSKEIDLMFHFHMLHSLLFYQDCTNVVIFVKNHRLHFNYSKQDTSDDIFANADTAEFYQ